MENDESSKQNLLQQRKEKKKQKQLRKRHVIKFAYYKKLIALFSALVLGYILLVWYSHYDCPYIDKGNTYTNTAICVDAITRTTPNKIAKWGSQTSTSLYFDNGKVFSYHPKVFKNHDLNNLVNQEYTLYLYDKGNFGGEILISLATTDGITYVSFDDYNNWMHSNRMFYYGLYIFIALPIFALLSFIWFPIYPDLFRRK